MALAWKGSSAQIMVGVLALSSDAEHTWIDQLYVAPARVGKGIGSALLKYALDTAPGVLRLYTFQENSRAPEFFERHGFAVIAFSNGDGNEEQCPDVLYELDRSKSPGS